MANLAIAIWLMLFGVLCLVSTEIPKWIVPLAACITAVIVAFSPGSFLRRAP